MCGNDILSVSLLPVRSTTGDLTSILFTPVWSDRFCDPSQRSVIWYYVVNGVMAYNTNWVALSTLMPITPTQVAGADIALPNGVSDIATFLQSKGVTLANGDKVDIYAQVSTCNGRSAWSNSVSFNYVDLNATCTNPLMTNTSQPLLLFNSLCLLPY